MKRSILLLLVFMTCASTASAAAAEKPLFGPKKYDVVERYGDENRYKESFSATEGLYLIKIQNGEKPEQRSAVIDFTLNGQSVLKDYSYRYPFIACVVTLTKDNSFEIMLRDAPPWGDTRPKLPPRFVFLSVMPLSVKLPEGAFGVLYWEKLPDVAGLLQKIKAPDSFPLAVAALNLANSPKDRAEAMRKLSDRKDKTAFDYITFAFSDIMLDPDIRGEASLALGALGDKTSITLLVGGILDDNEKVRIASSRALSFYNEDDTREQAVDILKRIDAIMLGSVIISISESGWKPISALVSLATSTDTYVSNSGIRLLGAMRDPRATAPLLKLLEEPGNRNLGVIITALGESRDSRAIEPLSRIAANASEREGLEVELANALASLGDQKSAPLIGEMIKKTTAGSVRWKLREAYKKLTGMDYK